MAKLTDFSREVLARYIQTKFYFNSLTSIEELKKIEKDLKIEKLKTECDELLKQMFEATEKGEITKWFNITAVYDEKFNQLQELRGLSDYKVIPLNL